MYKIRKWIRHVVINSLLIDPPPLTVILFCIFGSVFFIGYYCAHVVDQIDIAKYKPYSSLSDNIAGIPTSNWMPEIFPIDVVFTWVNGSDPMFIRNLEKYGNMKEKLGEKCSYENCGRSPYYIIKKSFQTMELLQKTDDIQIVKELAGTKENSSTQIIFTIPDYANHKNVVDIKHKLNITCRNNLYWTSDKDAKGAFAWERTMIIISIGVNIVNISDQKRKQIITELGKECNLYSRDTINVLECKELYEQKEFPAFDFAINGKTFMKTLQAYLTNIEECENDEDSNLNRYHDFEELKYSLRSIEKYMPWVRQIFIVTNGQIPHWLNLAHSRITVVTHEEIFKDLSYLPTFSSVAIEANIHRIPGLSEHFVYFNDDFFLGAPVDPDDFYSPSNGYKIYLSWNLPDCAPGCHSGWLKDGHCDDVCNTSACHYDGGDCFGNGVADEDTSTDMDLPINDLCGSRCTDKWLADSYCDEACNVSPCGFDCGDCGTERIQSRLPNLKIPNVNESVSIPQGELAVWFNLSQVFNESHGEITGSFSPSPGVRTIAVDMAAHLAVMVFHRNVIDSTVMQLSSNRSHSNYRKVSFKLQYNTHQNLIPEFAKVSAPVRNNTFHHVLLGRFNLNSSNDLQQSSGNSSNLHGLASVLNRPLGRGKLALKRPRWQMSIENAKLNGDNFIKRRLLLNHVPDVMVRGKFMWERRGNFNSYDVAGRRHYGRRRLLDMFSESLTFVNRLYNNAYGFQSRKVPSHVPYFINKTLLEGLIHRYSAAFDLTSSHKFRSSNDMQFSFSYVHYLMGETVTRSVAQIFSSFDTDKSGTWADRELRTFMATTRDLPVYFNDITAIHQELRNCSINMDLSHVSTPLYERYHDSDLPTITEKLVANCPNSSLAERLHSVAVKPKFKFYISSAHVSSFKMISSNVSKVVRTLDELRREQRKFICINNDMKSNAADNDIITALMSDFFESILPIPSSFELTDNYRNKFLYVTDLEDWKWRRNLFRALIWASASCLLIASLLNLFNKQVKATTRRWCRQRRKRRFQPQLS